MATTPQTNTSLSAIAEFLQAHDHFALCGHVNPDGDCTGSVLGLASLLRKLGKQVDVLSADERPVDHRFKFMPGIDNLVPAVHYGKTPEVFIALDVPNRKRLGEDACKVLDRAQYSLTIDHHASDDSMTQLVYVEPDAPAASMLVWKLSSLFEGIDLHDCAVATYTGLVTDTGCFQFQNVNKEAFECAAEMVAAGVIPSDIARDVVQSRSLESLCLQRAVLDHMVFLGNGSVVYSWLDMPDYADCKAKPADAEGLVDVLRSIDGVRVVCLMRVQDGIVRGSLRAKDTTNVAVIARELGGGGHDAAAGFTQDTSLKEAIELFVSVATEQLTKQNVL